MKTLRLQVAVSLAIGLVVLLAPALAATTHSRDQLIDDARQLARLIEDTHPDPFVRCGGRIAFYRALQDVLEAIPEEGMTRDGFVRLLRPLLAMVGDAHTDIWDDYQVSESLPGGVPLTFDVIEEGLYVAGIRRGDAPELLGARLLSVEGVPLTDLCDRQRIVQATENQYSVLHLLASLSLRYEEFMQDILPEWENQRLVHVELQLATGETRDVEYTLPKSMRSIARPATQIRTPATGKGGFVWSFLDDDRRIAYLRVDHMLYYREAYEIWDAAGSKEVSDEELAAIPSATESFRDLVVAMKEAGTETLIVDLRQNEGGHSLMADILLYFLYPRDVFLTVEKTGFGVGCGEIRRYSELYFESCDKQTIDDFNEGRSVPMVVGDYDFRRDFSDPVEAAEVLSDPNPAFLTDWLDRSPTFYTEYLSGAYAGYYRPKNVLVVSTSQTFSSGFTLARHLYLAGATLVGTPSGQSANCFGECIWWELEHTGIHGAISGARYVMFPEDSELAHVLPVHYPLTYEKLASYGFDPNAWLRYALELAEGLE